MEEINFIDEKDKAKLLKDIVLTVEELKNGKEVMKDIEKKVDQNEYDKAASLLRRAAKYSKYWPLNEINRADLGGALWVGILFMFTGLMIFLIWYVDVQHTIDSDNWPSTSGIVIDTKIIEHTDDDNYVTGYSPEIEYSYTVYGKPYISDDFSYNSETGEYEWADSIINQHPINSLIEVYYHPTKHKLSVLDPGFDPLLYIFLMFGYGFLLAGLIILIVKIKKVTNRIIKNDKNK